MEPFRYLGDPLFLLGTTAYVLNRWLLKPHWHTGFFHSHFNDLWLMPCALPLVLWLHRSSGLRPHDQPPTGPEILTHLAGWTLLFEWLGPKLVRHATADPWDAVAYAAGAALAALWWQRHRWLNTLSPRRDMSAPSFPVEPGVVSGHEL